MITGQISDKCIEGQNSVCLVIKQYTASNCSSYISLISSPKFIYYQVKQDAVFLQLPAKLLQPLCQVQMLYMTSGTLKMGSSTIVHKAFYFELIDSLRTFQLVIQSIDKPLLNLLCHLACLQVLCHSCVLVLSMGTQTWYVVLGNPIH